MTVLDMLWDTDLVEVAHCSERGHCRAYCKDGLSSGMVKGGIVLVMVGYVTDLLTLQQG